MVSIMLGFPSSRVSQVPTSKAGRLGQLSLNLDSTREISDLCHPGKFHLLKIHLKCCVLLPGLGQNAKSPQEVAQYACKKLSALQLLMLLLPAPAQALVMNLLTLLHKIAVCPATKMTSSTLGTIFAPIFFIDRKLEADDLYREVQLTAPAVSFMIEKASELFQVNYFSTRGP